MTSSRSDIILRSPTTPNSSLVQFNCCSAGWSTIYSEQLDVLDFTYVPETDQTTMTISIGGRIFDLACSAALFPSAVAAVELWAPGPEITSLFSNLAGLLRRLCGKQLLTFNRENVSLMAFLHIWNVRADPYDGHFGLGLPTPGKRIDELFEGIEYHDTDLSWYEWNLITVMEKMSDTHFLVTMNNQCFGCYIPEGAFEYEGYSIFLQEVRSWKRISFARNVPPSISRLSGFVYSRYKPTKLQGVLYEWVEPSHAIPYLSKVQVDEVPIQQRKAWSDQIEHALAFLHERSASFTREGCKGNITERITITTNMEAHLRLIHFGDGEPHRGSIRFVPHRRADYRALAQIRKFLRVDADATCIVNPQTVGFLCIPSEIRNRIYELLLVLPGYVRWHWGYRHQIDVVAGLESDKIAGIGLLGTNRQVRHESLSFLVSRNNIAVDAVWLKPFLRTRMPVCRSLEPTVVGSYLRRATVTITLTCNDRSTNEQRKGIKELVKYSSLLSHVDLLVYNKHTWYWEDDNIWADLKKLPGVHLEEHLDTNFLDRVQLYQSFVI